MHNENHYVYFNTRDELTKVDLDNVMYAASDGNCITIKFKSGRTLTLLASLHNFIQVTESIRDMHFERIDRSHVINTRYIAQLNSVRKTITLVDDDMNMSIEITAPKEAIKQLKVSITDSPRKDIPTFITKNGNMEAFQIFASQSIPGAS